MRAQTIHRCVPQLRDFWENSVFPQEFIRIFHQEIQVILWETHYFSQNHEVGQHIGEFFEPASISMVIWTVDYVYLMYKSNPTLWRMSVSLGARIDDLAGPRRLVIPKVHLLVVYVM